MLHLRSALRKMSFFKNRLPPPLDPVFSITENYRNDPSSAKVNLGVGAYQDENGKPWVLPVVRKVEMEIAIDKDLNKEYLPISGDPKFVESCLPLIFGSEHKVIHNKNVDGIQSLSGTGACRVGFEYLRRYQNFENVYFSNPTWAIHYTLSQFAGFPQYQLYTYFDTKTNLLNFDQMKTDLENAKPNSLVVLHGSGHNPTGVDPSPEQWNELSELFKMKKLLPFFDCAYMGFCSGDIDADAYPIRKFADDGHEMFVALSFAKIMGLYNERVGCLAFVNYDGGLNVMKNQMKIIARNTYSNPPSHGARIASRVLSNEENQLQWKSELNVMTSRILEMRQQLFDNLQTLDTPGDWSHIVKQRGLFSFTGLNKKQVDALSEKHHIYLTKNGRINICGLTPHNVKYVSNAIHDVVVNYPDSRVHI